MRLALRIVRKRARPGRRDGQIIAPRTTGRPSASGLSAGTRESRTIDTPSAARGIPRNPHVYDRAVGKDSTDRTTMNALRTEIDALLAQGEGSRARALMYELWESDPASTTAAYIVSRRERLRESVALPRVN